MTEIATVCVYCGSSPGADPRFAEAADAFGAALAAGGISLVYGGGGLGLMGTVARAVRRHGGHVTGVIPSFLLEKEGVFMEVDEQIVVPDMHTRKRIMFERADAFVAFPGGIGTLEELIEMMTWSQLGRHGKPILIADVAGFWAPLLDLLGHMERQGFIRKSIAYPVRYLVESDVARILPALRAERAPAVDGVAMPLDRF